MIIHPLCLSEYTLSQHCNKWVFSAFHASPPLPLLAYTLGLKQVSLPAFLQSIFHESQCCGESCLPALNKALSSPHHDLMCSVNKGSQITREREREERMGRQLLLYCIHKTAKVWVNYSLNIVPCHQRCDYFGRKQLEEMKIKSSAVFSQAQWAAIIC